jgi:hypothetical protein
MSVTPPLYLSSSSPLTIATQHHPMPPIITCSTLSQQCSLVAASTSNNGTMTVNCDLAIKSIVNQNFIAAFTLKQQDHTHLICRHFNNFTTPIPLVRSLKALIPIQMMNPWYVANDILCQLMHCAFLIPPMQSKQPNARWTNTKVIPMDTDMGEDAEHSTQGQEANLECRITSQRGWTQ